jgi:N-acetyltransferase
MNEWGPITVEGRWARLEPLTHGHAAGLLLAARDAEVWTYLPTHQPRTLSEMKEWIAGALEQRQPVSRYPHVIVERATNTIAGSTSYLDPSPKDRHIEIGWTWLGSEFWRTPINTECKYLLLRHAFEELDCIRVQLKTDERNERSQRAIERIGGVREGVLRKVVIVKDDYQRSSVYFSILDDEWPAVKTNLERRMGLAG